MDQSLPHETPGLELWKDDRRISAQKADYKQIHHARVIKKNAGRDWYLNAMNAAIAKATETVDFQKQHGQSRQLVKDGCWNVPVEQRPKGWQRMAISEPE